MLRTFEFVELGGPDKIIGAGRWNALVLLATTNPNVNASSPYPIRVHPISETGSALETFVIFGPRPFYLPSYVIQFWVEGIGGISLSSCQWFVGVGSEESDFSGLVDWQPLNATGVGIARPSMFVRSNAERPPSLYLEGNATVMLGGAVNGQSQVFALPCRGFSGTSPAWALQVASGDLQEILDYNALAGAAFDSGVLSLYRYQSVHVHYRPAVGGSSRSLYCIFAREDSSESQGAASWSAAAGSSQSVVFGRNKQGDYPMSRFMRLTIPAAGAADCRITIWGAP